MDNDALERLAKANPVRRAPCVESPERLRRLIEADGLPARTARQRNASAPLKLLRGVAAIAVAGAGIAAGLVFANNPASPSLNVAAAAYAATSSGGGVFEARFLNRMFIGPKRRPVAYSHREWIDTSSGMRRDRRTLRPPLGKGETYEVATSPGWVETWNNARWEREREAIHRVRYRPTPAPGVASGGAQDEVTSTATEGIETYRRLYLDGSIKLVGHERVHGRLLWKLESVVGFAARVSHGKVVPVTILIVLVDPHSYLPVVQRWIDVMAAKHPVELESELIGYRRLPAGQASESLLRLTSQHPHARIVTWEGHPPSVVQRVRVVRLAPTHGHGRRLSSECVARIYSPPCPLSR